MSGLEVLYASARILIVTTMVTRLKQSTTDQVYTREVGWLQVVLGRTCSANKANYCMEHSVSLSFKSSAWLTFSPEYKQGEVRVSDVSSGKLHNAIVALQEYPRQILHIGILPLAHLCHDFADAVLCYPDKHKPDWTEAGQLKPFEVLYIFCNRPPRNAPSWIDKDCLQNLLT